MTLGEWLEAAKLSKREFAEETGIRYATIHDAVEGRPPKTVTTAERIVDGMGAVVRRRELDLEPLTVAQVLGLEAA